MSDEGLQEGREALAALMAGQLVAWPSGVEVDVDWLLAWLRREGVVALVYARLRDLPGVPEPVLRVCAEAARGERARMLVRQGETRRVLARLDEARLPVLLLKGSALAYWAWLAPHLRDCADVDLLFANKEAALAAAKLLAPDGYARRQHFGDAVTREFLCLRHLPNGSRIEMDMHWDLTGLPLFRGRFGFDELMAASIPLPALAPEARGPGPVHALLHACVHRASDLSSGGGDSLKWLYDIHLLATALASTSDAPNFGALAALAAERGLAGVCVHGLDAAAALFATPLPEAPMAALRQAAAREPLDLRRLRDWTYFQRQNLRALPNGWERLRWIWQRLWPSRHYREDVGVTGGGLVRDRLQRLRHQLRRPL